MSQKSSSLLKKLALLVQLKSFTQKQLADHCGVSRITIHRFLSGKSEIKASDFVALLKILEIDVEALMDNRLRQGVTRESGFSTEETLLIGEKIEQLDPLVKKTVLKQIDWWSDQ